MLVQQPRIGVRLSSCNLVVALLYTWLSTSTRFYWNCKIPASLYNPLPARAPAGSKLITLRRRNEARPTFLFFSPAHILCWAVSFVGYILKDCIFIFIFYFPIIKKSLFSQLKWISLVEHSNEKNVLTSKNILLSLKNVPVNQICP